MDKFQKKGAEQIEIYTFPEPNQVGRGKLIEESEF
jgi:hypothetical protein